MRKLLKAVALGCAVLLASPGGASGQARFEVEPTVEIPQGYDTWSLFLICNPAWVLENGDEGVAELFRAYKVFGDVIGPDNLAIWFWKTPAWEPTVENSDLSRMGEYCVKYGLEPGDTPQVVATTVYPDLEGDLGDRVVANLNGSAENSAKALTDLADQLLSNGLDQVDLDDNERWRRIGSAALSALSSVSCYFNEVTISIKTKILNLELAHRGDEGC
jgi:hypothetical protein